MPARRMHRSPHEGRLYLADGQTSGRHVSGAPPHRPPRPDKDPLDVDAVLDRIDAVTQPAGAVATDATVVPLRPEFGTEAPQPAAFPDAA